MVIILDITDFADALFIIGGKRIGTQIFFNWAIVDFNRRADTVCPLYFSRRSGINARKYVEGGVELKGLTLDHVVKFEKELKEAGIENPEEGPILLPDYTTDEVNARRWNESIMEGE